MKTYIIGDQVATEIYHFDKIWVDEVVLGQALDNQVRSLEECTGRAHRSVTIIIGFTETSGV